MNMLSKNKDLNPKMFLLMTLISCVSLGVLISCSEKSGSGRGILIEASEQSITIPMIAWATLITPETQAVEHLTKYGL